ncbi:MAG: DUF4268 domain-containing protein, partial [Candidatus Lokiarchaeota archaeon]|nr:DUF4268 domain-containing protein [Candidatus Lokiarchaeota archaeon]
NNNTINDVALYLVKAEIIKIPNASPTLIFQKILEPKPKGKSTIRQRTQLREIERKRIEFWEILIEKIYNSFPEHANMIPQKSSWIFQPTEKEGMRYAYVIKNDWASIELYFDHPDKQLNVKRFKELYKRKEEIDRKFNDISWNLTDELEWDLNEERSHQSIRYRIDTTGLNGREVWDDLQIKMIDAMKCLVESTEPYITSLPN